MRDSPSYHYNLPIDQVSFQLESLEPRQLLAVAPMAEVAVHYQITDVQAHPQRNLVYLTDVTNWRINAIDTEQARYVMRSPKLADRPSWLTISPDGNEIFVAETLGKQIQVLDATDLSLKRTMTLSFAPADLVAAANNRLYVRSERWSRTDFFELNATTGQTVKLLTTMGDVTIRTRADGRRLYLMGDEAPTFSDPVLLTYDTGAANADAALLSTQPAANGGFAIDEHARRAYITNNAGGMLVLNLDTGTSAQWRYANNYSAPRDIAMNESSDANGDLFVQLQRDSYIRQFRRGDGSVVVDYKTVWQADALAMEMTPNGRVLFVESAWNSQRDVYYVGIIGSATIKAENTPPLPKLTATAYSSHNFLFDATTSLAGAVDEKIIKYQWDLGDGTQGSTSRLYHNYASAGTYDVRLTVTDSNGDSKSIVTPVTAGNTTNTASISGRVFRDSNGDGRANEFQVGEYLQGRTVFIDSNGDRKRQPTEPTATTDAHGNYALLGLAAGTYRVRLVRDQDEAITAPRSPVWTVTLTGGQQYTARNFGCVYIPAQTAMVISDLNANEIFDLDEPVFANRTVWLDANDNQRLDAGEATYQTDSLGRCQMRGLLPGRHIVRTVVVLPGERLMRSYTMKITPYTGNTIYLPVRPGGTSTLGGIVFDDPNLDGVRQISERPLAGHTVFHDVDRDGVFDPGEPSALSDANGHYLLTGLDAGMQLVGVAPARKWRASTAVIRNQRDVLRYGGGVDNRHIGLTPRPLAVGSVFFDTNNNGRFDTAVERGLAERVVFADLDDDGEFDESDEPHALTDALGGYRLDLPAPGTYTIRLLPRAGHFAIAPARGFVAIAFKTGQTRTGYTFAESLGIV